MYVHIELSDIKMLKITLALILCLLSYQVMPQVATCPDPETSSLKWGEIPPPWLPNPFSSNLPQADDNTLFKRANILVAGYGQGVLCTYSFTYGEYSIWWPVRTKIPAPEDYHWIDTLGGYVCNDGLDECKFYVIANAKSQ